MSERSVVVEETLKNNENVVKADSYLKTNLLFN